MLPRKFWQRKGPIQLLLAERHAPKLSYHPSDKKLYHACALVKNSIILDVKSMIGMVGKYLSNNYNKVQKQLYTTVSSLSVGGTFFGSLGGNSLSSSTGSLTGTTLFDLRDFLVGAAFFFF